MSPEKGEKIYVPSVVNTLKPDEDFDGGIATIKKVEVNDEYTEEHANYITVVVEERPGHSYGWRFLQQNQTRFKAMYGKQVAGYKK